MPPQLDNYLELETSFEKNVRSVLRQAHKSWQAGEDMEQLMNEALERLKRAMAE